MAIVAIWAWTQRYSLIENFVVNTLAETGFEAELKIISLTKTHARVQNIRIKQDGEELLTAQELRANYVWPDIRDGKLKRVELDGAKGRLTFGKDWRPTDPWLVDLLQKDGSNSGVSNFPEQGIALKDAALTLSSPLGETTFYIDALFPNSEKFDAEVTLAPSDLAYRGFAAKGAGFASLSRQGETIRLNGQTQTDTLSNDIIRIEDAHLKVDGVFNLNSRSYQGQIGIDGQNISSALFAADALKFDWNGNLTQSEAFRAEGAWSLAATAARTPRNDRAAELAATLSLAKTLNAVPIAEHFSPSLTNHVKSFFLRSDLSGQGKLIYGPEGFIVSPQGPVILKTDQNRLSLTPVNSGSFYKFEKKSHKIAAKMNAEFEAPVGLQLNEINIRAKSLNGIRLDGIERFSAKLTTSDNWHTRDINGQAVRLGPLSSDVDYRSGRPRRLTLDTSLNYDGELPGGRVTGLTLTGLLNVGLYEDQQVIDFIPQKDTRVTLTELQTPTDWRVENLSLDLPPTQKLFVRTAEKSTLTADLSDADFTLTRPMIENKAAQRLELKAAKLAVTATLFPDKTQNWKLKALQAQYQSETLPAPGTQASTALANLNVELSADKPPQIELISPSITAETPLMSLTDMQVKLSGTPDSYRVDHNGGFVSLIGTELAETAKTAGLGRFPADGVINFANNQFTGRAGLSVAKANNAPMTVAYNFMNSAGTAKIDIPSIEFTPKGLQPQALLPALRGKIARVEGEARALLEIAFAEGALTESGGTVELINMDVGTAPGPITGLNTTLEFTSLLPLETAGIQSLTMKTFNPGLPLKDGIVTYQFVPEGVSVNSAQWPIGNGAFSLDPFTWVYAAEENRVTMRVKDVSLSDFFERVGNRRIDATGNVVGVFPIVIRGVQVLVENGRVSVPEGGVIKYDPGPATPKYSLDEAVDIIRKQKRNEFASLAQDALREFNYRRLSAKIDGPLDGDMEVGLEFDGANQKVLNSQPFRFDVSVQGKLINIARSINFNEQAKAEILRQYRKKENAAAPD